MGDQNGYHDTYIEILLILLVIFNILERAKITYFIDK